MGRTRTCVAALLLLVVATAAAQPQSKPGCPSKCGDIEIPYPFGTRPDCYLNDHFSITCNDNTSLILTASPNLTITNITEQGYLQVLSSVSVFCSNYTDINIASLGLGNANKTFTISNTRNRFTVIGCDSLGAVHGMIDNRNYTEGCVSVCSSLDDNIREGTCSGSGCCQIDIPTGLQEISVVASNLNSSVIDINVTQMYPCSYAFVVEDTEFNFSSGLLTKMYEQVPTAVDWAITGHANCQEAEKGTDYACKENSTCDDQTSGYLCKCKDGYEGNPYLGCSDINECEEGSDPCDINAECVNLPGSFRCNCKSGYRGNGTRVGGGCFPDQSSLVKIILGTGLGFLILLGGSFWLYLIFRKRRLNKLKEKFFRLNGGLLLQQQLSERNGSNDHAAKIFSEGELKKATDNFDDKRIIGRGGFGTVYKGVLADNSTVAIKKSKVMDQTQVEQFINEVTVLSQINHRNVVKLLGCCLETEVPLLVYEYISNGTLFDHIHNKDGSGVIPWDTRLRIAAETAGVLAYLHSSAATPIIHRDVKSTNILLDDNFTAKVSDFGASKLVPIDETQLSTLVRGTLGYLDPEYLHTSQLTEKSDVYSFGAVVVELMTGKKVVSFDRPEEERSLVVYFLSSLKEGKVFEILEKGIVNDDNAEQMREVAALVRRCLNVSGEERPKMKEVAMELEGLRRRNDYMSDAVEVDVQETEHFLSTTSFAGNDGDGNNSTTGYDSIMNHVSFEVNGGR